MRVLFATWSSSGPLRPLIPVMRAARDAGHDLIVMGDRELVGNAELDGLPVRTLPDRADVIPGFDATAVKRATEALPPPDRPAFEVSNMLAWGTALAPHAIEVVDEFRPDVICREFAFHAAWLAAEARQVPSASFMLFPISERLIVEMLPGLYGAALQGMGSTADAVDSVGTVLEMYALPPQWFGPAGPPPGAVLTRPSEPAAVDDGTAGRLLDGLGVERPLVYATLGTTFADEPHLFRALLDGVASVDVDVIATTGPTVDPADFVGYPDRIRIRRFVPQSLVLPRCAAVVGHAGYGTTFGAMQHGVPMVVVPIASSDNALNARNLTTIGAARALHETDRTAGAIAAALREVLDVPTYRSAAQRFAVDLSSMPGPERAVEALELLARR